MPPDGGVMFVHAHPDDESMSTGGTMARLVAEGIRVDLVTCTDGAEGEIHDPTLDPDEARPRLAQIRADELACSVHALGSGAIHHHMLGYRDSGMIGTDANAHPESFWQSDLDEATRRLTEIVRAAQPSAIVSYDDNGNYGHPDHINAARIARQAYQASRGVAGRTFLRDRLQPRTLDRADVDHEGARDRASVEPRRGGGRGKQRRDRV